MSFQVRKFGPLFIPYADRLVFFRLIPKTIFLVDGDQILSLSLQSLFKNSLSGRTSRKARGGVEEIPAGEVVHWKANPSVNSRSKASVLGQDDESGRKE